MASDNSEPIERWTAKRRAALVISMLKGETTAAEAARKHGLTVGEIDDWRERLQQGAENALRARPKDEDALHHRGGQPGSPTSDCSSRSFD